MVAQANAERQSRCGSDKWQWKIASYLMDAVMIVTLGLATWAGKQLLDVQSKMGLYTQAQETALIAMTSLQSNQEEIAKELGKLREWRAETTASRFTATDGREVWREIAAIRETIARLSLTEPPLWLVDRIKLLEQRLHALENRMPR